jgi:hypothetical protein
MAKKLSLLAVLGNTAFIAIPLCTAIFGPIGGLLAAIFDAGLDLVLFTVGVYLLQSNKKFSIKELKSVINMPLIAIMTGMFFVFSGLEAPMFFKELTSMLSGLAAPLAMLYIGLLVQPFLKERSGLLYKEIWYPLGMKLIIIPAVIAIALSVSPIDEFLKFMLVILTSMPTFLLAPVLFSRHTEHESEAAITTVYSTLLSIMTIPLISLFAVTIF